MKKINSNTKSKILYKTKTFDEVFKGALKSENFKKAYSEEITRLRLAREVRLLRTKRHLTQEGFAEKVGMPQSVISRIESGGRSVSVDTLGRIAFALGKEVRLV